MLSWSVRFSRLRKLKPSRDYAGSSLAQSRRSGISFATDPLRLYIATNIMHCKHSEAGGGDGWWHSGESSFLLSRC